MYDMIIGMDMLTDLGLCCDTEKRVLRWEGAEIPLKKRGCLQDRKMLNHIYELYTASPILEVAEERQARILDADYSAVDIEEHVETLKHLNREQKEQLKTTLMRHLTLFGGGLGQLDIKPISLELLPGAKPYHARAFPIPKSLERTTKVEIERLTKIGVFEKCYDSEWAAPTFVQPKKTGDVRILTDFRRLNLQIKRKPKQKHKRKNKNKNFKKDRDSGHKHQNNKKTFYYPPQSERIRKKRRKLLRR